MLGKADLCPLLLLLSSLSLTLPTPIRIICAGSDKPRGGAVQLNSFIASFIPQLDVQIYANPTSEMKQTLLASADIFLSPGDGIRETFGISLLEAMAVGLPLVTTDWSGYREIVEDGGNGFLIPTAWHQDHQSVERFTALSSSHDEILSSVTSFNIDMMQLALRTLINNVELRQTFGRRSREIVMQRYSWSTIIEKYDALFFQQLKVSQYAEYNTHYPYVHDLFSHYPTTVLQDSTQYKRGPLSFDTFAKDCRRTTHHPVWMSDEILNIIEEHVAQHHQVSLGDIVRCDIDPHSASLHLGRLCKYGILEVASEGAIR